MPLSLSRMPFEFNSLSPTPLDPYNLDIHGLAYAPAALEYMRGALVLATEGLEDSNLQQVKQAEAEIEYQHRHRIQKNDQAMQQWREQAAKDPRGKLLSRDDAEGVLQVRAGISRPSAILELISRNPQMGGIEIAKATRPFCISSHILAREALKRELDRSKHVTLATGTEASPYRFAIDEHNLALITKTRLGVASLNGAGLEIVTRESGIIYNPAATERIPEAMSRSVRGVDFDIAPLDVTSYVRVKSSASD